MLAAGGYPGSYEKGKVIRGLDSEWPETTKVFHAGTDTAGADVVTQGGRVLCVSALGASIQDAIDAAYRGVEQIHWDDMIYRRDIGWRAIDR